MMAFIQKRVAEATPGLFARQILQQLDQPDLIGAWRITLGETSTEGLFALLTINAGSFGSMVNIWASLPVSQKGTSPNLKIYALPYTNPKP